MTEAPIEPNLFAGGGRVGPSGAGQFDGEHGAVLVKLALLSDEHRGLAANGPELDIGWLLADHRGHDSCNSSEHDLDFEVVCFARSARYGESVFAARSDGQSDQARAGRGGQHGYFCLRGARPKVLDDGRDKAIREIRRQMKLGGLDLVLAVFSCRANNDLAGAAIDEEVDWLREGGTFLNMVVSDESEGTALGKDGSFVVDGAVFEVEGQLRGNLAAADNLYKIARCHDMAVFGTQLEKAMNGAPRIANGNGVCFGVQLPAADYEDDEGTQWKAIRQIGFHSFPSDS